MGFVVDVALMALALAFDAATAVYDWATDHEAKLDREIAQINADLAHLNEGR